MEIFLKWLVLSSENPDQTSMTIRGILLMIIPALIAFLQQIGVNLDSNIVIHWIDVILSGFGLLLIIIGMIRKLINTVKNPPLPPATV